MKWWVIITGIALVVGGGFVYAAFRSGVPVEAASAERGEIRQFVDERGKTRLPQIHLITMPFDGRIEEITLVEGDPVAQAEAVARVVQSDLQNDVDEAQAVVDRLQESIKRNDDTTVELTSKQQSLDFVESMKHAVEAALARVTSAQKGLEYAQSFLDRTQRLRPTGAKTEEDLDRAELDFVTADVGYKEDLLVWQSMVAIEAATKLLPQMITQYIDRKGLTHDVLEKEKAEAQARLRQIKTLQERGTMRSPVDGVVLERPVRNERLLAGGTEIMRIGRLEELEVEAEVLSQDVVDVQQGDEVEIYGPAIGARVGEGVKGFVDRVYPAGFTKVSSLGVEQQRVKVVIHLAEGVLPKLLGERDLGVDYRVRARIFTDARDDALVVPRSALFRGADGQWQVFAIRSGRARLAKIEVGLMNDRRAEVTKGLEAGDRVILSPESNLTDGTRVKPIGRK
jgi:HlyD family secretion protein